MIHDNPWSLVSSDVIRIYQNIVLLYYLVRSCAILIYFILSSAVRGLFGSSTICKMACSVAVWFDAVCICLDFINAYLKVTVVMCFCRLLETSPAATVLTFSIPPMAPKNCNITFFTSNSIIVIFFFSPPYRRKK